MNRDHISLVLPRDKEEKQEDTDFTLYVMDLSYFSGKMEAYFRYQDLNWDRVEPSLSALGSIKLKSGTSQVPLVWDSKAGLWLRDTTYIMQYLEEKYPEKVRRTLPSDQVESFLCLLLEDWADEYLWRPAMYYRWEPRFDAGQISTRFSWEFLDTVDLPFAWLITKSSLQIYCARFRQWLFSVFGEGVETTAQHKAVQAQYLGTLAALQSLLSKQPFIFGTQPTRADFGLMGPFFRHFSSDPTPRKILQQRAPAVLEWVARMWNCKYSSITSDSVTCSAGEAWELLQPFVQEYLEYLHSNAVAWRKGQENFLFSFQGVLSKVQTVQYRVWCRLELQRFVIKLKPEEEEKVNEEKLKEFEEEKPNKLESLLREAGCWESLWQDGMIECLPEQDLTPPYCCPPPTNSSIESPKWPAEPLIKRFFLAKLNQFWSLILVFCLLTFALILQWVLY